MKLIAAVLFVATTATTAAAQGNPGKPTTSPAIDPVAAAAQDCARFRKQGQPCVLTFGEGDTIEAGVQNPGGFDVTGRTIADFSSLIRIRADFRAEIIRAAENI